MFFDHHTTFVGTNILSGSNQIFQILINLIFFQIDYSVEGKWILYFIYLKVIAYIQTILAIYWNIWQLLSSTEVVHFPMFYPLLNLQLIGFFDRFINTTHHVESLFWQGIVFTF